MPHEMFVDAVVRPISPRARKRRRLLTILSFVLHVLVVAPIAFTQMMAVGTLPVPRRPVIFEAANVVKLVEIPVPRARGPQSTAPATDTPNPNAFVNLVPDRITPEPAQPAPSGAANDDIPGGVPNGIAGGMPNSGVILLPAPPPPAPHQDAPIHLHSGMQMPRRIVDVAPVYPQIAVASRKEGIVILEAILDARGNIESVRVLRSDPMLEQAAIEAVKRWKYTPAMLNGVAVPVIMTVTVNFTLR